MIGGRDWTSEAKTLLLECQKQERSLTKASHLMQPLPPPFLLSMPAVLAHGAHMGGQILPLQPPNAEPRQVTGVDLERVCG